MIFEVGLLRSRAHAPLLIEFWGLEGIGKSALLGTVTDHVMHEGWQLFNALVALIPYVENGTRKQVLETGVETARAIELEDLRSRALATLDWYLEVDPSNQAPEAVGDRNESRRHLVPRTVDDTVLWERQQEFVRDLWDSRDRSRAHLLHLLAYDNAAFLRTFELSPKAWRRIAHSMIDICTKWE